MQRYEKMVYEIYFELRNETIMSSFIENINVDFDIQPKNKNEKNTGKTVQKHKDTKTFDASSKDDNVKKIHLCN